LNILLVGEIGIVIDMDLYEKCFLTFANEPFETHACTTYSLAVKAINRIHSIVEDRIKNITENSYGESVARYVEEMLNLFEIAVLFHDIGKLLPIYPLDRDNYTNFYLHEIFSFYILKKALSSIPEYKSKVDLTLIPILMHHSSHRWILDEKTLSVDIPKAINNLCSNRANTPCQLNEDNLSNILKRACLCINPNLYSKCLEIVRNIANIMIDLVNNCKAVLHHIEKDLKTLNNIFRDEWKQLSYINTILTPILQMSDRLAAKIVRRGDLQQIDYEVLKHMFFSLSNI